MSWQEPKWIRKPRRSEDTSLEWREPGGPDDAVEPPTRRRPRSNGPTLVAFALGILLVLVLLLVPMRDVFFLPYVIAAVLTGH